jgi:FixJ family two-component response regulator
MSKRRPRPGPRIPLAAVEAALGVSLAAARERHARLSMREAEVAALMAVGLPYRQVAEWLRISPRTLQTHSFRVRVKLQAATTAGVANVVNLVRLARFAEAAGP